MKSPRSAARTCAGARVDVVDAGQRVAGLATFWDGKTGARSERFQSVGGRQLRYTRLKEHLSIRRHRRDGRYWPRTRASARRTDGSGDSSAILVS